MLGDLKPKGCCSDEPPGNNASISAEERGREDESKTSTHLDECVFESYADLDK